MKRSIAVLLCGFGFSIAAEAAFNVYFLRHGETDWNREKRLQGSVRHTKLTTNGRWMALATGTGMAAAGLKFDRVYASPYERARETAELVVQPAWPAPVPDARLREMCFGKYEGLQYGKGRYPDENLRRFFEGDEDAYRPQGAGAESLAQVQARLRDFLERELKPLDGKVANVLCVAHSLVLKSLVRELAGANATAQSSKAIQPNCCVHVVRYENGRFSLVDTGRIYYDAKAADARQAVDSCAFARIEYETHLRKLGIASVTIDGRPARMEFVRRQVRAGDEDSFRISAKTGLVTVEGGSRGVLYGLYELLERYAGIVWCASWYTHVPKPGRFDVPDGLDEVQTPAFPVRWPGWAIPGWRDGLLAVRQRYNSTGVASKNPEYGGVTYCCPPHWGSHTYKLLCPVEKYGKAHPEYFSEIRGKRRIRQTQLCTTNPDVRRIARETLFRAIRKHPDCDYWSVSHNDYGYYCECPACRAINEREESPMGCELEFVNYLAGEVAKEFPGKLIKTSAYQHSRKPPKFMRPRDNVVINICAIECDVANPFGTPGEPAKNTAFLKDLDTWCAIAKNVSVYDYTPNYRYFMHPFPNLPTIAGNLRLYHARGVTRPLDEGGCAHADLAELKAWLLPRLAWDPSRNLDRLVDEFCRAYYGEAAESVKRYIRESRACIEGMQEPRLGIFEGNRQQVFTHEFLDRMIENFSIAESKLGDDPARLHNLRMTASIPYVTKLDYMADEAILWWATEKPETFPGAESAKRYFDWVEKRMAEAEEMGHPFLFSANRGWNAGNLRAWKRLKAWKRPAAGSRSGWVPAAEMDRGLLRNDFKGGWLVREVEDAASLSGGAAELNAEFESEIVGFSTKNLALDVGKRYRVRIRVRGEPGTNPEGEAFQVTGIKPLSVKGAALTADYRWHDVGTMTGGERRSFQVSVGRVKHHGGEACQHLILDGVEFSALE